MGDDADGVSSTPPPAHEQDAVATPDEATESAARRLASVVSLLLGVVALIIVFYFGAQLIGVLYSVLFPPVVPVPPGVTQTSHDNPAYGVDVWGYTSQTNTNDLVAYYEEQGATCGARQSVPEAIQFEALQGAVCRANVRFSVFTMHYEATIVQLDLETRLSVEREIYWIGTPPL